MLSLLLLVRREAEIESGLERGTVCVSIFAGVGMGGKIGFCMDWIGRLVYLTG